MKKIAFAVHGGASECTPFINNHIKEMEESLAFATRLGYKILDEGGSALDAVEQGVQYLEDDPMFNAGRGSSLNCRGEVEMDASIMDGQSLKAGAVALLRGVRNPISLARVVMKKTNHVFLSGNGALEIARNEGILFEPEAYFITEHQYADFHKANQHEMAEAIYKKKMHGTVGAVALDVHGNLAAATSTGGTSNCLPGRIGDTCVIGGGCYANNQTCAVSGTGEGEYLITGVIAHSISMMIEQGMSLQEACDYVLFIRNKNVKADIGVISVDFQGNIGMAFNSQIMKRAWMSSSEDLQVKIFE